MSKITTKNVCRKRNICKIISIINGLTFLFWILLYIFWYDALITILNNLPGTVHLPDTNRNIFEIIESRGFNYESHFITTDGGNILQMVRIINPFVKDHSKLKPIFLQHGFQSDGRSWLIARDGYLSKKDHAYYETVDDQVIRDSDDPDSVGCALGFVLSSRGYDVWLANYRGSPYSTNHTTLDPWKDSKYWEFSIDELIEDLKSSIDYVMETTGHQHISYIGHSQGNFMMLGLLSKHPKFSEHIKPYIAIAPVFYMSELKVLVSKVTPIKLSLYFCRNYPGRFIFSRKLMIFYANLCENILFKRICYWTHYFYMGSNYKHFIWNRIGVYWSIILTGSSRWNYAQFLHIEQSGGKPTYFDYGDEQKNLEKYKTKELPIYNASKIISKHIALIYCPDDYLNSMKDINELKANLNVELIYDHMIKDVSFNHIEQIQSNKSGEYVNRHVLKILTKY